MPNDMSHSHNFTPAASLSSRTERYCARAKELALDPGLTATLAERALEHLCALQDTISVERSLCSQPLKADLRAAEAEFEPLEARLNQARLELSGALMRATPDTPIAYGVVSHGPAPAGLDENVSDVRPVSACRTLLDLEALRPYLSDDALRQAIVKYGQDTGHHDVQGVAYAVLPHSAHMPCDVL